VLLLGTVSAGKHGRYIGCFDLSLMELSSDNSQVSEHTQQQQTWSQAAAPFAMLSSIRSSEPRNNSRKICNTYFCVNLPQVRTAASGKDAYMGCAKACTAGGYSMTLIGADYSCRCAGQVPPAAALLWDTECAPGGTGIAAFYNHAGMCWLDHESGQFSTCVFCHADPQGQHRQPVYTKLPVRGFQRGNSLEALHWTLGAHKLCVLSLC
jgi:hypothetical protein